MKKIALFMGVLMILTMNAAACYITIYKFNDSNGNGIRDNNSESYLPGFTFRIESTGYNQTRTTDAQGRIIISVSNNKDYIITEEAKTGWVSTTANPQTVRIRNYNDAWVKFGNMMTTTTTTTTSSTTTIPTAPEFGFTGTPLAALLIVPAFAYLVARKKE